MDEPFENEFVRMLPSKEGEYRIGFNEQEPLFVFDTEHCHDDSAFGAARATAKNINTAAEAWAQRHVDEAVKSIESECDALRAKMKTLVEALQKLRDCDWTISLPDRMDAVRSIAKKALEGL
jgi:hypothetical protein